MMNGAIRREDKVKFSETPTGVRTSRWLDDIAAMMDSKVGISSERDVSSACHKNLFSKKNSSFVPVINF
jgi:hypothetical protein